MSQLQNCWLVAALMFTLGPATTHAIIVPLQARLDCSLANGGVGHTDGSGTGFASVMLDETDLRSWNITWSELSAVSALRFPDPATPFENPEVEIPIGSISGITSLSIGSTAISEEQVRDLLTQLWHVNTRTNLPAGEIRSQAIPEPATTLLVAFGLAGLAAAGRRRQGV